MYPFDPTAVLDHNPCVSSSSKQVVNNSTADTPTPAPAEDSLERVDGNSHDNPPAISYSQADELLFETRYEQGYDLYDPKYVHSLVREESSTRSSIANPLNDVDNRW